MVQNWHPGQRSGSPHMHIPAMCQKVSTDYLAQATLLLIQGLALEPLLELVAAGKSISGSGHPFADLEARQKVHDVLGSWWHHANDAHAPVLMAWAVFAALVGSVSEGMPGTASPTLPLL